MSCPLCGNEQFITIKRFNTSELSNRWEKRFGFDPFKRPDCEPVFSKIQCPECKLVWYAPPFFGDQEFYEMLSQQPWYYEDEKWEFNETIKLIMDIKPKSLLEIGCGTGCFLEKINTFVHSAEGIDINTDALAVAKGKGLSVSSTKLQAIDKQYEMLVLFEVLEHLDQPSEVFENILRILKPNGLLIIATPNPDGYMKEADSYLLDMPPHHNSSWSVETFDYIADKYNLSKIAYRTEPLRYVHYVGCLQNWANPKQEMCSNTLKSRLLFKIKLFALQTLAPFYFTRDRQHIVGQTHLVALKKG